MSNPILVLAERIQGEIPEVTYELLGKARELAETVGGEVCAAVAAGSDELPPLGAADIVYLLNGLPGGVYAAPPWEAAISSLVAALEPQLVLMSTGTIGIDLAASMAARMDAVLASYVVELSANGAGLLATSQLYGGKLLAESEISELPAIVSVIPGSFPAEPGRIGNSPRLETFDVGDVASNATGKPITLQEPDSGGIDIAAAPMLVSVGRGIGSKENLELVEELAGALKAPLSASRPIIDQGWLPKPHQVGKSGKKVKPSVYLAFGISGAPEHLEGMRNSDTIIACNTDPKAPIFEVAHYGTTVDLFDLVPELTDLAGG